MAEVLGTVVGVMSLGLQVCTGINTYLDRVQCRKEDLEHTKRCCKSMKALLKQIESLSVRIAAATGVNTTTIGETMAAAKTELSLLDEFVGEICTINTPGSSRSAMERIRDQQKKFLYPFRTDHLYRLNDRLETANGVLHSALQLAELGISLKQGHALQGLQVSLNSLTHGVSTMHLEMNTAVRQLHSEAIASHLVLASIEKTSDETTSLLTMSHKDTISLREDLSEMKTMLAALVSSDGRAILPKLVSKPDALRKISNIVGIGNPDNDPDLPGRYQNEQTQNRHTYPEFQCNCNPRRVSRGRRRQVGLAFMEQERVTEKFHASRCPFSFLHAQSDDKWSFGISTKALQGILHAGLTISISATFGAGGFGLSPSFTYFPIRETSPAIEAIWLLKIAFGHRVWSDEEANHLFRRGIKTLQVTMAARKWSAFDVNSNGSSILEDVPFGLGHNWHGNRPKLLAFLLNLGAPRDRPNNHGFFPLHYYVHWAENQEQYAEAFDFLWADEVPFKLFNLRPRMHLRSAQYPEVKKMQRYKAAANVSAKMRKLYKNHLMQAIIQESKSMLLSIVDKGLITSELSDTDPLGYKLLHYLLGWPEGLRVVIEQCGNSVLQLDDQRQTLLLECALDWSGKICNGSNLEFCSHECCCAEAVRIVLEAERSCPLQLREHEHWVLAMLSASVKARSLVIEDLSRRREELKELGLLHLSSKQIDRMGLREPKVLDYYASEVLHALKTEGVTVAPRLETEMKALREDQRCFYNDWRSGSHDLLASGPLSSRAASVYHILGASPNTGGTTNVRALVSSLYSKGFSDIDVPDCAGVTPLTGRYLDHRILQDQLQWNWCTSIEFWLIEHGASLETQVHDCVTGYTATHQLFRWIGFQSGFTKERNPFHLIHSSWESKGGFTRRILDVCRCKCSIGGCNPYNIMWKILLRRFHAGWRRVPSWPYWSEESRSAHDHKASRHGKRQRLMSFILEETSLLEEACELPRPVKSICLRACTFEVLPLRHTCCDRGRPMCDDEEIREIWDEDQIDIGRLETLMDEFEKRFGEMDCGLAEFYREYWIERMSEVLRQMDEQILTATEMEDVERLGVRLTVEAEDSDCEKTKFEDMNSLEYWFQEMDALV